MLLHSSNTVHKSVHLLILRQNFSYILVVSLLVWRITFKPCCFDGSDKIFEPVYVSVLVDHTILSCSYKLV